MPVQREVVALTPLQPIVEEYATTSTPVPAGDSLLCIATEHEEATRGLLAANGVTANVIERIGRYAYENNCANCRARDCSLRKEPFQSDR